MEPQEKVDQAAKDSMEKIKKIMNEIANQGEALIPGKGALFSLSALSFFIDSLPKDLKASLISLLTRNMIIEICQCEYEESDTKH